MKKEMKKRHVLWLGLPLMVIVLWLGLAQAQDIYVIEELFPDAALAEMVATNLGLEPTDVVTKEELMDVLVLNFDHEDADRVHDFTGLHHLPAVEHVYITYQELETLEPFTYFDQLRVLEVSGNDISDLSPLFGMENLEQVRVAGNPIVDISALSGSIFLQELDLSGTGVADLSPLAGVASLEVLNLSYLPIEESQLAHVSGLTGLRELRVRGVWLDEVEFVRGLSSLEVLELVGNEEIADLSPLVGLTGLVDVVVSGNAVSDVTALGYLPNLTRLDVSGNQIRDLRPLSGLALEMLNAEAQLIELADVEVGDAVDTAVYGLDGGRVDLLVWLGASGYDFDWDELGADEEWPIDEDFSVDDEIPFDAEGVFPLDFDVWEAEGFHALEWHVESESVLFGGLLMQGVWVLPPDGAWLGEEVIDPDFDFEIDDIDEDSVWIGEEMPIPGFDAGDDFMDPDLDWDDWLYMHGDTDRDSDIDFSDWEPEDMDFDQELDDAAWLDEERPAEDLPSEEQYEGMWLDEEEFEEVPDTSVVPGVWLDEEELADADVVLELWQDAEVLLSEPDERLWLTEEEAIPDFDWSGVDTGDGEDDDTVVDVDVDDETYDSGAGDDAYTGETDDTAPLETEDGGAGAAGGAEVEGALPRTGADSINWMIVGGVLLVAGVGGVVVKRRGE